MKKTLLAIALSALAAGCATDATTQSSSEDINERVYRTGSNIPTKQKSGPDGVQVYDREALSRTRDQTVPTVRPGLGGGAP